MKLYWTISVLALLAAVLFGIFAHRQDQKLVQLVNPPAEPEMEISVSDPDAEVVVAPTPKTPEPTEDSEVRLVAVDPSLESIPDPDEPVAIHRPEPVALEKEPALDDKKRILPFVFHANASDKGLMLQGSVPTRDETVALYEAAIAAVGDGVVENHLKYSPETVHERWIEELPDFIQQFFAYTGAEAQLTIVDGKMHLIGDVASNSVKGGLIAMGRPFREGGLTLVEDLQVRPELADSLPSAPDTLPKMKYEAGLADSEKAVKDEGKTVLVALNETSFPKVQLSPEPSTSRGVPAEALAEELKASPKPSAIPEEVSEENAEEEAPEKTESKKTEMVFYGPDKDQELAQKQPDSETKEEETAPTPSVEEVASAETEPESAAMKEKEKEEDAEEVKEALASTTKEKIPDDGKPLIFYFDTGSAEILPEDQEKVDRAIQRAGRPRSIVYITAYADYRGSYELNRKLSLERAENVRKAIFSGEIADQVTAEITAKGDTQSVKQDLGRREETDEALRRARRVVVEVYHLK